MKNLVILTLLFFLLNTVQGNQGNDNYLTKKEIEDGLELLFDGKSLKEWRGFGLKKAPDGWVVEEGTIKILPKTNWPRQADGQPILGADLITVKTFDDFELTWDWKIGPGGNSGVKYNVSEELSVAYPPKGCALGFEYQLIDDERLKGNSMHRCCFLLSILMINVKNNFNQKYFIIM